VHVQLGSFSSAFNQLIGEIADRRKTRPDIFHPVYCVGILFTASLFARVSSGIVISVVSFARSRAE